MSHLGSTGQTGDAHPSERPPGRSVGWGVGAGLPCTCSISVWAGAPDPAPFLQRPSRGLEEVTPQMTQSSISFSTRGPQTSKQQRGAWGGGMERLHSRTQPVRSGICHPLGPCLEWVTGKQLWPTCPPFSSWPQSPPGPVLLMLVGRAKSESQRTSPCPTSANCPLLVASAAQSQRGRHSKVVWQRRWLEGVATQPESLEGMHEYNAGCRSGAVHERAASTVHPQHGNVFEAASTGDQRIGRFENRNHVNSGTFCGDTCM